MSNDADVVNIKMSFQSDLVAYTLLMDYVMDY
jgi:hypothetical protein